MAWASGNLPNHWGSWQNIPNVCNILVQIWASNNSAEIPHAGQWSHKTMGQQPPLAALTGQLAHFYSKTALAEKLKTDKINYVAQNSRGKKRKGGGKKKKKSTSYQRCPSPCPRNCGCSSYISPSPEGLTDHFWRHKQMGRKAQMSKSVLFSSIPQIFRWNGWGKIQLYFLGTLRT